MLSNLPADATIQCDTIPPAIDPIATDNCDADVEITLTEVTIPGACTGSFTITRTWTATDNCGNSVSWIQTILADDLTAPVITGVPPDQTVLCDSIPIAGVPDASDNCDSDVQISFDESTAPGACPDSYTITRTWAATDNCGNSMVQSQIITVQDDDPPVLIGVPADLIVECDSIPVVATPTAIDNCDIDIVITFDELQSPGTCANNYTITRTWTAIDNCNNTDVQTQYITVQDTTEPVIDSPPADITVECMSEIPSALALNWTDNCDGSNTIFPSESDDGLNCPRLLTRTWEYTDSCGNATSVSQTITINDQTPPILDNPPADITVDCGDAIPALIDLNWTDNCDGAGTITGIDVSDGMTDPETITRSWTYTDGCGNTTMVSQVIVVQAVSVTIDPTGPFCENDDPVTLNGNPGGGIWAGDVSTDEFDPAVGPGTYNILYIYSSDGICFDTAEIDIIVRPIFEVGITEKICEEDTYDFHGTLLDASGVYVDTLTAGNGCDSIVTLTLDVLPEFATPVSASICEGDTYDFHGTLLDASGVYVDTLTAGNGCDSIVTLTLDVLPEFATPVSASICEGDIYDFHGTLLDASGVYV